MPDDEKRKKRIYFIDAYFKDLENKVAFLDDLFLQKRSDEALILCCCYIEGLAGNYYWPEERSFFNFVRIFEELSEDDIFRYIHLKQLKVGFESARNKKLNKILKSIETIQPDLNQKLFSKAETQEAIEPHLPKDEVTIFRENLWRGTIAALAYQQLRNLAVHNLGAIDISFNTTKFKGTIMPNLDFKLLQPALKIILGKLKKVSLDSGYWYGHNYGKNVT